MGITLNLQAAFGNVAIFSMLILSINEQERSFNHLISYSIFFLERLEVIAIQVFHLHSQSYPKLFYIIILYCIILFVTFVKGVSPAFFLRPFVICIWENYRFFQLILYPANLLKMFISCRIQLVVFWDHLFILSYNL